MAVYVVYGAEGCTRCERAKRRLEVDDHEVVYHNAEHHSSGEIKAWRSRILEFVDFKAQLCFQNEHLPVIYHEEGKRFLQSEELEKLCKR